MGFLNGSISPEEVQAVLQLQSVDIAPDPDEIFCCTRVSNYG